MSAVESSHEHLVSEHRVPNVPLCLSECECVLSYGLDIEKRRTFRRSDSILEFLFDVFLQEHHSHMLGLYFLSEEEEEEEATLVELIVGGGGFDYVDVNRMCSRCN